MSNETLPRIILPRPLLHLRIDCRVAEGIRLLLEGVREQGGVVESAFMLWGEPPSLTRPARVTDFRPLNSTSSAADVAVSPEDVSAARDELMAAHPGEGDKLLSICHSHPGENKPYRSRIDRDWHASVLDMHYREDLVVPALIDREEWHVHAPQVGIGEPIELQCFYSVIFPCTGDFNLATTYLLARPVSGPLTCDLEEIEIDQVYTETVEAAAAVARYRPTVQSRRKGVTISYGCGAANGRGGAR